MMSKCPKLGNKQSSERADSFPGNKQCNLRPICTHKPFLLSNVHRPSLSPQGLSPPYIHRTKSDSSCNWILTPNWLYTSAWIKGSDWLLHGGGPHWPRRGSSSRLCNAGFFFNGQKQLPRPRRGEKQQGCAAATESAVIWGWEGMGSTFQHLQ